MGWEEQSPELLFTSRRTLEEVLHRPAWQQQALCRGTEVRQWFEDKQAVRTAAKAICAQCVVRQPCLEYALADSSITGVWGGTSAIERAVMRRDRKRAS